MCCQPLTAAQAQAIHGGAALGLAFERSGNPVIGHLTPRMNRRITCVGNFGSEVCVRKVFVGLTMHDKRLQLNLVRRYSRSTLTGITRTQDPGGVISMMQLGPGCGKASFHHTSRRGSCQAKHALIVSDDMACF